MNNGGCQQLCFHQSSGGHACACAHGYLAKDGLSCHKYDGYLLYSERSILRSIHLSDESDLNSPIRPYEDPAYFKNVIALAFHHRLGSGGTNRIFFSDVHFGNIQVVNDNWTERRVVVESKIALIEVMICLFVLFITHPGTTLSENQTSGGTFSLLVIFLTCSLTL